MDAWMIFYVHNMQFSIKRKQFRIPKLICLSLWFVRNHLFVINISFNLACLHPAKVHQAEWLQTAADLNDIYFINKEPYVTNIRPLIMCKHHPLWSEICHCGRPKKEPRIDQDSWVRDSLSSVWNGKLMCVGFTQLEEQFNYTTNTVTDYKTLTFIRRLNIWLLFSIYRL